MKFKIEIDIADDVDYEEVEYLDTMAELFDELDDDLDGWFEEEEIVVTLNEEFAEGVIERYDGIDDILVKYVTYGDIGGEVKNEIKALFDYVVLGKMPYFWNM